MSKRGLLQKVTNIGCCDRLPKDTSSDTSSGATIGKIQKGVKYVHVTHITDGTSVESYVYRYVGGIFVSRLFE